MKMNEIVNRFLLASDKFMPEMHLKQSDFTYSACHSFSTNKESIEKFMQTGNTDLFTEKSLIKLVSNMICLWEIKRFSKKFWEIKHLKLWVMQNMMVIKED